MTTSVSLWVTHRNLTPSRTQWVVYICLSNEQLKDGWMGGRWTDWWTCVCLEGWIDVCLWQSKSYGALQRDRPWFESWLCSCPQCELSILCHVSEPRFLRGLWRLLWWLKCSAQCLAYSRCSRNRNCYHLHWPERKGGREETGPAVGCLATISSPAWTESWISFEKLCGLSSWSQSEDSTPSGPCDWFKDVYDTIRVNLSICWNAGTQPLSFIRCTNEARRKPRSCGQLHWEHQPNDNTDVTGGEVEKQKEMMLRCWIQPRLNGDPWTCQLYEPINSS